VYPQMRMDEVFCVQASVSAAAAGGGTLGGCSP
jgi:hypothetical protein